MKAAEPAEAANRPFEQVSPYNRPSMSAASQADGGSTENQTKSQRTTAYVITSKISHIRAANEGSA